MGRGDRFGAAGAAIVEQENALEGVGAAVELVDDEGAGAGLHEDAFFGKVEDIDILNIEDNGAIGIAGMRLHPADDEDRQQTSE